MSNSQKHHHIRGRVTGTLLVAAVLALMLAAPSFAGKSTISLVTLNASTTGASTGPTMGSQVSFNVSTTATSKPFVDVQCYQNGTWVYEQWQGFFAGWTGGQTFTLGPTGLWQSGAADCTADLVSLDSYKPRVLTSMKFHVSG